ncbi:MAG: 30S ribosomal protein S16 [Spirochaetales bacterium]|jgi:small subunit ribosomal protein S16|nr:30S ribosomal protein S16 [Spirochaetales bacterium]
MAVSIRLTRRGKKKKPFYRIVAADSQCARDGKFLEILGTYDPMAEPVAITIKEEKMQYWLDNGATASDTVKSLIAKAAK